MARLPQVLLLSEDRRRRQAWERSLGQAVEIHTEAAPPDAPEVVVTDRWPVGERLGSHGDLLLRGEIGIVGVGIEGPADVVLPADCSARELRLACRLLGEIIRLRRRHREDRHLQRTLRQLAYRDALTHLANRRAWDEQLATRLEDVQGNPVNRSLCVALLDLDLFKHVNDRFGHAAGDSVLGAVSARLAAGVRQRDVVARVGGDEFAVILGGLEPDQAGRVVERVRRSATHAIADPSGAVWQVTASAGYVTVLPGTQLTPQDAMAAADRCLREAKEQGRDRTIGAPYTAAG